MNEIAIVFRALNINKKTVAELTADEKSICRQAYKHFKSWAERAVSIMPNSESYEYEIMNWQFSGYINDYFWARIFDKTFKTSAPCISISVDVEGLWISLMWHRKKAENSQISLMSYNEIIKSIDDWVKLKLINPREYEIFLLSPAPKKTSSAAAIKYRNDIWEYSNNETIKKKMSDGLASSSEEICVIRRVFPEKVAQNLSSDDEVIKNTIINISWLYQRVCNTKENHTHNKHSV